MTRTPDEIREARLTALALVRAEVRDQMDDAVRLAAEYEGNLEDLVAVLASFSAASVVPAAAHAGISVDELLDRFTRWVVSDDGGTPRSELQ